MTDDEIGVCESIVSSLARRYAGTLVPVQYEDLVGAGWLSAVEAVRDFSGGGSLRGYVYWRVRNGMVSYLRSVGTRYPPWPSITQVGYWSDKPLRERSPGQWEVPATQPQNGVDASILLNRLDPRSRVVVEALFYRGLTRKQIARSLQLSETRISQIAATALEKMRAHAD